MNRRTLLGMGALATGSSITKNLLHASVMGSHQDQFRFAVIADTHIIDEFYVRGSENGPEDNESILLTTPRLTSARNSINAITPKVEQVFLVGDCFHNYPSLDYEFYFKNKTRLDYAREILDGFQSPVQIGFGNHDYDPRMPRETSHRLFEQKLRTKPYFAVDYKGFRFIHLNNFLGGSWGPGSTTANRTSGTLGEEQLNWLEAQLEARRPTVLFIHYPLWLVAPVENKDYGAHPLIRKYKDSIQIVIAGHWHKWVDFANTYGPHHMVMASTRYDQNAFMLFEANSKKGTIQWVDAARPQWSTHFTQPYA